MDELITIHKVPRKLFVYARLMRLHQPVGILLLMLPCWIGAALASQGKPDIWLLFLFALGAAVMRSFGCIINDMADRKLDASVERTKTRPLASGELSVIEAFGLLFFLLIIGFIILLQFKWQTICLGCVSLLFVITYPFMKRITYWPQVFLGLTFNWGVLLAFIEITGHIPLQAWVLYLSLIFWTIGYDTIYALQDKADDIKTGIRSSAIAMGGKVRMGVALCYAFHILLFIVAASYNTALFCLPVIVMLVWQVITLNENDKQNCLKRFKSNVWVGIAHFIAYMLI